MTQRLLSLIILIGGAVPAFGIELQKLISESQRIVQGPQKLTMVWWLPTEFWDVSMRSNPNTTEGQREQFRRVVDDYLIFAVGSLDIGPFAGLTAKSKDDIIANTSLTVGTKEVSPLKDSELSADAANFVRLMKPIIGQMLGQIGQGMEFILYPNAQGKGKIRAAEKGEMRFVAFGENFEWKLPLTSLLPPKVDPKTKQEFPGDFRFNPYTGDELVSK